MVSPFLKSDIEAAEEEISASDWGAFDDETANELGKYRFIHVTHSKLTMKRKVHRIPSKLGELLPANRRRPASDGAVNSKRRILRHGRAPWARTSVRPICLGALDDA